MTRPFLRKTNTQTATPLTVKMETEKANGQYGKQNPLFMYQGTAGYSIRAELHGSKGGVEAAEAFTAVPSASGQDRCGTMP